MQESVKKVENSSPFFCQDCVCSVLKSGVNFCLRGTFNQMKNDHKSNKSSSYGELLTKDTSVTIHHRNIRALAIEIYKLIQGISPPLLNEVYVPRQCSYELRGVRRTDKSVRYGTESISSLAPKIWEILPNEIKDSDTLQIFKAKIKKWVPVECPCRLCKIYLSQVGFI